VQSALSQAHDTGGKLASDLKIMPADWLTMARDQVLGQRDKVYGGFDGGGETKFPQSPVLNLLLTDYRLNGTAESLLAETASGKIRIEHHKVGIGPQLDGALSGE